MRKRWDQYGRYSVDEDAQVITVSPTVSREPLPVSFGPERTLCSASSGIMVSIIETDDRCFGVLALRLDKERGLYRELTVEECRAAAAGLGRMADLLEGKDK